MKERSQLSKYSNEYIIRDLLSILDIFEQALEQKLTPENAKNILQGVQMTSNELRRILETHGLKEVKGENQLFDPNIHEALSNEETNEVPEGTITKTLKKAYNLHDRLLRPGQVIVAVPKKEDLENLENTE